MKKFICFVMLLAAMLGLCACDLPESTIVATAAANDGEEQKLSFMAEFYDNKGQMWMNVEGTTFNIKANRIKEYSYDTDGFWTYSYATSSIVSIDIDGKDIESCGSTVIFYDTRLVKHDMELPTDTVVSDGEGDASIFTPSDGYEAYLADSWNLSMWYWYNDKDLQNDEVGSRIVVVQSQRGDPICMFSGESVSWDVSKNLPKTTEICIDGKMLYIHRANFAIIDTDLF